MPESQLLKVVANFTGITRNETLHGKNYLVAPAIMIVEGVLNGSLGPLLYLEEEMAKSVSLWNTRPTVLYHPQKNGQGISACDPDVLNTRGLGMMMNTRMEEVVVNDKKIPALKTEVWLDMKQVAKVDGRVLKAIENKEVMELSTGLLTDNEMMEGEWEGVHYDAIARNYRPDHLAILPDQTGACSIEDGAGFLRLNKAGKTLTISTEGWSPELLAFIESDPECKRRVTKAAFEVLENEMSDEDRRGLLQSLLNDKFPEDDFGPWIDSIFSDDDFFIYDRDGKLYKQEFEEDDGVLKLIGIPIVVAKRVTFEPILNRKGKKMPKNEKKKIVDALIKNESTQWTDDNREWLMTQEKDVLENMVTVVNDDDEKVLAKAKEIVEKAEAEATKNKKKEDKKDEPVTNAAPKTMDEYLKDMPPEMRDMVNNGIDSHKADKKRLVNIITANDRCSFTEKQLEGKNLTELRQLAELATTTENQRTELSVVNYAGQGETHNTEDSKEEPLPLPALNFDKQETSNTK